MRNSIWTSLLVLLLVATTESSLARKEAEDEPVQRLAPSLFATDNAALASRRSAGLNASAVTETVWLHSATFNNGSACTAEGWTSVDLTAQLGEYWHVDDYAGLPAPYGPLEGSQSMWCGLRATPDPLYCAYLTLPGYGNAWDQRLCTKTCVPVAGGPTAGLDVSFAMRFDSEPSYDATWLEYTADCTGTAGWIDIDGGQSVWDGIGQIAVNNSYALSGNPAQVKVRLRFFSDWSWSDEDGLYPSNGAVSIDSLKVEGLALETFEDEALGATGSNDWEMCNEAYGNYAGLFKGSNLLQEDDCVTNISCMWAFIQGSTATYACGGHPEQLAVPYEDSIGRAIENDIWSPYIELIGSGTEIRLAFDVYRDFAPEALPTIGYIWKVRAIVNGCPTAWQTDNFFNIGSQKDWYRHVANLGSELNLTAATHLQVAVSVLDLCPWRCWGPPPCHSHSPLIDNVKVYRVDTAGPQWTVRDIDLFQDTFSSDGTITGTARADMARDIRPSSSPSVSPGDSAIVLMLADPTYASGNGTNSSGLSDDPVLSTFIGRHKTKKQAYLYVAVWPLGQPGKSGAPLSEGPGGQANRYPFMGTVVAGGVSWTKIRMDYSYAGTASNPGWGDTVPSSDPYIANRFNVDLNDNMFTPGDTVCYFFGATSPGGTTYYSDQWQVTNSIEEVAANPMELTILPAGGYNRGGDVLYVDGADGTGSEPYFHGAFMALNIDDLVDRYDVRGPSSAVANTPDGRVVNIQNQLNNCYGVIVWDTGALPATLGDGDGSPKTDDYGLLNTYLANGWAANPTTNGGVYLCGDDVAQNLTGAAGSSAVTFRTVYMPFTLISGNHAQSPTLFNVSPAIIHWPGRLFTDDFIIFGGCPGLNDFDVVGASGASRVEMSYNTASNANGAVVSKQTAVSGGTASVILSGFSFANIRDDEANGVSDRAEHMAKILLYMGHGVGPATPVGSAGHSSLAQNYPNPFNPQTTIAFSIKARGHVALSVYDVGGRLVRELANEVRAAGAHTVTWDGRDGSGEPAASGVYFYRLTSPGFSQTRKMVLLK